MVTQADSILGMQKILKLVVCGVATAMLIGAVGCSSTPEPEPVPGPIRSAVTPPPEPAPQPGVGPECPTKHCVSVAMSGDLLFHPGLWNQYAIPTNDKGQNFDFTPLLEGQKAYLSGADLAICQMETPVAPVGGPYSGYPMFSIPPEVVTAAKEVGYDACTTSSNHSVDQGTEGLLRTLDVLDAAGIAHTGTYRAEGDRDVPLIVKANNVKIAIVASTFSLNGLYAEHQWQTDYSGPELGTEPERVIAKAKKAREMGADIVISVQHVGTEYSTNPDTQQISSAQTILDSGAVDFVYNHHTHSVLPLAQHGGKWIAFGLGNTISESAPPERRVNNEFLMLRVQFAKQEDKSWVVNNISWNGAMNKQGGRYKWCSVMPDHPQGTCESESIDQGVYDRIRSQVYAMNADDKIVREWLLS